MYWQHQTLKHVLVPEALIIPDSWGGTNAWNLVDNINEISSAFIVLDVRWRKELKRKSVVRTIRQIHTYGRKVHGIITIKGKSVEVACYDPFYNTTFPGWQVVG